MTFKEALQNDLDVFINTDEFATPITYKGNTINGIYDNTSDVARLVGIGVESASPRVVVKSSDVVGVKSKDVLVVDGVSYYVIPPIQFDGEGLTTLLLSEDEPE